MVSASRANGQIFTPHVHPERPPISRLTPSPAPISPVIRNISTGFDSTRAFSAIQVTEDTGSSESPQQWSSAVGKANLGKSGRVIDRLMSENDMLKRDLQIAKYKVDESKQDVKVAEGKMEALTNELEAQTHAWKMSEALIKRRDRQIADLKSQIDGERQKAAAAVESEKNWRNAMENMEIETKRKVDEARSHVLLVDGRYNTLASHWQQEGARVEGPIKMIRAAISDVAEQRIEDMKTTSLLRDLLDEKSEQVAKLQRDKNGILVLFEAYKAEQENLIRGIKEKAKEQDTINEKLLEETRKALEELKWSLAVKRNMRDFDREEEQ
jgi:chromosome segregation ATPase